MAYRKLELTLISANNLENVRWLFSMKVHCRVSLGGQKAKRTPTDTHGGLNPAWYHTMDFTVAESMLENYNTMLVVKLYCTRMLSDRYVGEINIPIKQLFDHPNPTVGAILTFWVQKGSITSQGTLMLSYKFGEKEFIDKPRLEGGKATTDQFYITGNINLSSAHHMKP